MADAVDLTRAQLAWNDKMCLFKPAAGPKVTMPAFDPSPRRFYEVGMDIEYNHAIPMRDGVKLQADIFLPISNQFSQVAGLPIVLAITPYGKQTAFDIGTIPPGKDFDAGFDASNVPSTKYLKPVTLYIGRSKVSLLSSSTPGVALPLKEKRLAI